MENRRNFYRILEVQPDASFDAIRHNYKLLLHKLRMHPDLGGNSRDAALINLAYETLRDPEKRLSYDRQLLKRHNITTLSRGHLQRPAFFPRKRRRPDSPTAAGLADNRRNYYRILDLQPDAHAAVIRERYMALLEKSDIEPDLLHEAYVVLNNAKRRAEYDRLLKRHGHRDALKKMRAGAFEVDPLAPAPNLSLPPDAGSGYTADPVTDAGDQNALTIFRPLITQYCVFCKTPHDFDPRQDIQRLCPVCACPLFSVASEMPGKTKRALVRIKKQGVIVFYVYWPSRKLLGHFYDITPLGLGFITEYGLDAGQIIKIDGENFKAAAEVVHSRAEDLLTSNGVCFRTVVFHSPRGNFLEATV